MPRLPAVFQRGSPAAPKPEVKKQLREMAPVFESQGVHREALAALRLFQEAVQREDATAALARQMVAYLYGARNDPERRFEGAG